MLRFASTCPIVIHARKASSSADSIRAKLAALKKAQNDSLESKKTPPNTKPLPPRTKPSGVPTPESVRKHREAMKAAFPEGWNPPRKISREAMEGLRVLHAHDPAQYTTSVLADKFKISPEAVRRILKSKWQPSEEKREKMVARERKARIDMTVERRRKEWKEMRQVAGLVRSARGARGGGGGQV